MSYEIIYDRRFIKVAENEYLPMVLQGSSNCTMLVGRREILERSWWAFFGNAIMSEQEMLDKVIGKTGEWFKYHSKWVADDEIVSWIKNGCKNAMTVEEYAESYYPLRVSVVYTRETEKGWERKEKYSQCCRTTEELLNWIKEYADKKDDNYTSIYTNYSFGTIKALEIRKPKVMKPGEQYVCKLGKQYLTQYTDTSISTSGNLDEALIFTSADEFEKAKKSIIRFNKKYKLVATGSIQKKKNGYCILVSKGSYSGRYIKRISSAHFFFAYDKKHARQFTSMKQAEKYIAEKLTGRCNSCEAFMVEAV